MVRTVALHETFHLAILALAAGMAYFGSKLCLRGQLADGLVWGISGLGVLCLALIGFS